MKNLLFKLLAILLAAASVFAFVAACAALGEAATAEIPVCSWKDLPVVIFCDGQPEILYQELAIQFSQRGWFQRARICSDPQPNGSYVKFNLIPENSEVPYFSEGEQTLYMAPWDIQKLLDAHSIQADANTWVQQIFDQARYANLDWEKISFPKGTSNTNAGAFGIP